MSTSLCAFRSCCQPRGEETPSKPVVYGLQFNNHCLTAYMCHTLKLFSSCNLSVPSMLLACDFNQDKIPPITGACSHGLPTLHHRLFPLSPHPKMLPLCSAGAAAPSPCAIQLGRGGVLVAVVLSWTQILMQLPASLLI